MTLPRRVVVLGGTGFVGRSLCERLVRLDPSMRITVPTRRPSHGRSIQFLPTTVALTCDVHDDSQLESVLAGHDACINLIAILHGTADAFDRVHVQLARRLAAACGRTGVMRVVHVSALRAAADAPSLYLRSKAEAESVLQQAGLELSVLRPSVLFGAEDRFLNLFARLQSVVPFVPLGGARARFQPAWVEDLSEGIVHCLERPQSVGRTYECAGPKIYTLEEIVRLAGRWSGHERPIVRLPDRVAHWHARLMELLPGTPLLSRDNLRSMQVDSVATPGAPGLQALGIEPAALEAVAPSYLTPELGPRRLNRWRRVASRAAQNLTN